MQDEIFLAFMQSVYSARKRAIKTGVGAQITKEYAEKLWKRCGGKCEVTGICFDLTRKAGATRRPWAPSLDQIKPGAGYNMENVRVVCSAVNLAMNQWGEDVIYKMAAGIMSSGKSQRLVPSSATSGGVLPKGVRMYFGSRGNGYYARVRPEGSMAKDIHLGVFLTVEQALNARLEWAREHKSAKVMQEVFQFTQEQALMPEIERLSPEKASLTRKSEKHFTNQ